MLESLLDNPRSFTPKVAAVLGGRGVYRAMIRDRWDLAVERGTPALTVMVRRRSAVRVR